MKISIALVVSAAVVLGISACAAPPAGEESENVGETTEALSRTTLGSGSTLGTWGGTLDPGTIDPLPPPTFGCPLTAESCEEPRLTYVESTGEWKCMPSCIPNGGYLSGSFNLCPWRYPRHSCDPVGNCYCY